MDQRRTGRQRLQEASRVETEGVSRLGGMGELKGNLEWEEMNCGEGREERERETGQGREGPR